VEKRRLDEDGDSEAAAAAIAMRSQRTGGLLVFASWCWATLAPPASADASTPMIDYWNNKQFYYHSSSWTTAATVVLASLVATVVVAVVQGAVATIQYRRNFGDAPAPRVPCHGVVIVAGRPNKQQKSSIRIKGEGSDIEDDNDNGSNYKLPPDCTDDSDCLRLLVIGDSLAVGVGQTTHGYPVMPEEIAKELSKGLGKVVYWTCCGESGASTPWIIRMLQQSGEDGEGHEVDVGPKDDGQYGMEGHLFVQDDDSLLNRAWTERLDRYRSLFDPQNLRPYDVVVLVTGTNDLKSTLLPFLLDNEDRRLREQIKGREGGFIEDVRLFMTTLNAKMERRVQKVRENLGQQVNKTLQDLRDTAEEISTALEVPMDDYLEQIFGPRDEVLSQTNSTTEERSSSVPADETDRDGEGDISALFVLPAMPARALPSLRRKIPLRWLAIPAFDAMDRKKKRLARLNRGSVLFVDGLSFQDIVEFEEHRGPIWEQRRHEDVLLSLRDIGQQESRDIEEAMEKYYNSRRKSFLEPGAPGTKFFSRDGIHPDVGAYTIWGEFVGRWAGERGVKLFNQCSPLRLSILYVLIADKFVLSSVIFRAGRHIGCGIVKFMNENE